MRIYADCSITPPEGEIKNLKSQIPNPNSRANSGWGGFLKFPMSYLRPVGQLLYTVGDCGAKWEKLDAEALPGVCSLRQE